MSILSKKSLGCKGVMVSNSEIYPAYIENVSEEEIHLQAPPSVPDGDSSPGCLFRLAVTPPSGESCVLLCRIRWSYKKPPQGMLNIVAEIAEPLSEYRDFYRRVH